MISIHTPTEANEKDAFYNRLEPQIESCPQAYEIILDFRKLLFSPFHLYFVFVWSKRVFGSGSD